jgi:hypothetical protein
MLASGTDFGRSKKVAIAMVTNRGGSFQLKRLSNNSYIVIHTKTAIKNRKRERKIGKRRTDVAIIGYKYQLAKKIRPSKCPLRVERFRRPFLRVRGLDQRPLGEHNIGTPVDGDFIMNSCHLIRFGCPRRARAVLHPSGNRTRGCSRS